MFKKKFAALALMLLFAVMPLSWSLAKVQKAKHDKYFVCTRSNKTNMRNGPGEEYILLKVLATPNMPVLVMHQIEDWVNVRAFDGSEGWVYLPILKNNSSCRSMAIKGSQLRRLPDKNSQVLYTFESAEFVKVLQCKYNLCRIRLLKNKVGKVSGWVEQQNIWGQY